MAFDALCVADDETDIDGRVCVMEADQDRRGCRAGPRPKMSLLRGWTQDRAKDGNKGQFVSGVPATVGMEGARSLLGQSMTETAPSGVLEEVRARSATIRAEREAIMLAVTRSSSVVAEQVQ